MTRTSSLPSRKPAARRSCSAGLWTETCVALPTIQAIHDGYEVYVAEDCCGDVSQLAHDNAMRRVVQAGAKPVTSLSTMLEWQRDWANRDTYDAVMDLVKNSFRRLWQRRGIRLHDGAWRTGHCLSGVRRSRRPKWPTSKFRRHAMNKQPADLILHNGKIATQDDRRSLVEAAAIRDGKFLAIGSDREMMRLRDERTKLIDLNKRTVIPGLNDSHLHLIRGGLNYNLELRWDGVPSLADGLRMLREQAQRTPPGQWVRVVGGWSEFQFAERRMPTLDELNRAAPDTPVFVLHLYDRALLNRAALRAVGYTKDSPNPPGGEIVRDSAGNPTGILIARPNAMILYSTLAKGPKLPPEYQVNSSRHFMRELNRLGITSAIDAGGRLSELSGGLPSHRTASQEWRVDRPDCLQSVYAEAQGRTRRFPKLERHAHTAARRRLPSPQRRRGDAGLFGRGFRGLSANRGPTCLASWSRN